MKQKIEELKNRFINATTDAEKDAIDREMDALDNWAAGYMRGGTFEARAHETRAKHSPALTGKLQIPVLEGPPCIRAGDVLGRYFYYALSERADKERINEPHDVGRV